MEKRVYNKPMLMTEAFVPQEYVAACATIPGVTSYAMSCRGEPKENPDPGLFEPDEWNHSEDGCLRTSAFRVDIKDNKIVAIYEAANTSGYWNTEGPCENIKILNGPIVGDGAYELEWTTRTGWIDMPHSGTLVISTSNSIKHMS